MSRGFADIECLENTQAKCFFRVGLADMASIVVGMPQITNTMQEDVMDVIRLYGKTETHLNLPDPYEIFDFTIDYGMVSWQEHCRYKKTYLCWRSVGVARVFLESLRTPDPGELPKFTLPNYSLNRATQMIMDFSVLQTVQ